MTRKIERDGVSYTAERERFYCPAWDHFSQSRYMCHKWGWKLTRDDGVVIYAGYNPIKRDTNGISRPDFITFNILKETVEEMPQSMWEREIRNAERRHTRLQESSQVTNDE